MTSLKHSLSLCELFPQIEALIIIHDSGFSNSWHPPICDKAEQCVSLTSTILNEYATAGSQSLTALKLQSVRVDIRDFLLLENIHTLDASYTVWTAQHRGGSTIRRRAPLRLPLKCINLNDGTDFPINLVKYCPDLESISISGIGEPTEMDLDSVFPHNEVVGVAASTSTAYQSGKAPSPNFENLHTIDTWTGCWLLKIFYALGTTSKLTALTWLTVMITDSDIHYFYELIRRAPALQKLDVIIILPDDPSWEFQFDHCLQDCPKLTSIFLQLSNLNPRSPVARNYIRGITKGMLGVRGFNCINTVELWIQLIDESEAEVQAWMDATAEAWTELDAVIAGDREELFPLLEQFEISLLFRHSRGPVLVSVAEEMERRMQAFWRRTLPIFHAISDVDYHYPDGSLTSRGGLLKVLKAKPILSTYIRNVRYILNHWPVNRKRYALAFHTLRDSVSLCELFPHIKTLHLAHKNNRPSISHDEILTCSFKEEEPCVHLAHTILSEYAQEGPKSLTTLKLQDLRVDAFDVLKLPTILNLHALDTFWTMGAWDNDGTENLHAQHFPRDHHFPLRRLHLYHTPNFPINIVGYCPYLERVDILDIYRVLKKQDLTKIGLPATPNAGSRFRRLKIINGWIPCWALKHFYPPGANDTSTLPSLTWLAVTASHADGHHLYKLLERAPNLQSLHIYITCPESSSWELRLDHFLELCPKINMLFIQIQFPDLQLPTSRLVATNFINHLAMALSGVRGMNRIESVKVMLELNLARFDSDEGVLAWMDATIGAWTEFDGVVAGYGYSYRTVNLLKLVKSHPVVGSYVKGVFYLTSADSAAMTQIETNRHPERPGTVLPLIPSPNSDSQGHTFSHSELLPCVRHLRFMHRHSPSHVPHTGPAICNREECHLLVHKILRDYGQDGLGEDRITQLTVGCLRIDTRDILQFANLEHLDALDVVWTDRYKSPLRLRSRYPLKDLELDCSWDFPIRILGYFPELESITIKEPEVPIPNFDNIESIMIETDGCSLQHFYNPLSIVPMSSFTSLTTGLTKEADTIHLYNMLSRAPALQELDLKIVSNSNHSAWTFQLDRCLRSCKELYSLSIHMSRAEDSSESSKASTRRLVQDIVRGFSAAQGGKCLEYFKILVEIEAQRDVVSLMRACCQAFKDFDATVAQNRGAWFPSLGKLKIEVLEEDDEEDEASVSFNTRSAKLFWKRHLPNLHSIALNAKHCSDGTGVTFKLL
ncbi:hypothetical protein CVT24_009014 [Panaeolus cyanescens]|uniref:Uncharacterized protein n=1 Tax=Panaeolus cyanescens TaxID=181874 RepID=A0A409YAN9_9AGAR|nr:hypothetical protein CVT24_009014 [Panaeolus cyanescens]